MKNMSSYITFFLFGLIWIKCSDEFSTYSEINRENHTSDYDRLSLKNFLRLENPFSISNMEKALESLKKKTSKNSNHKYDNINISATHLYVKFTPNTEAELQAVKQDTLIELYEHPLDIEITESIEFVTSNYNLETPPELWASININHEIPQGCPFEILEYLYIPDIYKNVPNQKKIESNFSIVEELINESFFLTGNKLILSSTSKAPLWTPRGRIRAKDRAIEGVKVRARVWFTTHIGYTTSLGYFVCDGRFRNEANYSIIYEKPGVFDLRDGAFGQANYNGPRKKGFWDYNATEGRSLNYSYIFKSTYDYLYKNPFNKQSPPTTVGPQNNLKISYYHSNVDEYGNTDQGGITEVWRSWFSIIPIFRTAPIRINRNNDDYEKIYSITSHELTHLAHWKLIVDAENSNRWSDYQNASENFLEGWAVFMEAKLTRHFIDENYDRYPPINTYKSWGTRTEIGLELNEVVGISCQQIEEGLIQASSLVEWKENLKDLNSNLSDEIEATFAKYINNNE